MADEFIFDFYLLRSPVFPLNSIFEFLSVSNLTEAEDYLHNSLSNPCIKEALFLSSPELYKEIEKWLNGKQPINEKLLKTLYKYITRMGARCTPYGQFSGVCLGKIDSDINESLRIVRNNRKNSVQYRLDMQSLVSLSYIIISDQNIKTRLKFTINSTLYRQGDVYKFYQQIPSSHKIINLLGSVRSTSIMDYVFSEVIENISYNELIDLLLKKGASNQQANNFVNKMIDSQLIVSELQPSVTGKDYFTVLLEKMAKLDKEKNHITSLRKIAHLLESHMPLLLKQREIEETIRNKYPNLQYKNLLQGDLLLGATENKINKYYIEEIGKQLNSLHPLSISASLTTLDRFKKEFSKRYESRMVSMLEALDPDTGIPYRKNPTAYSQQDDILKGIDLRKQEYGVNIPNSPYQDLSLKLYSKSLKNKNSEVLLEDCDINTLKISTGKFLSLPSSYFAIGNILEEKLNDDYLFNLCGYGGTSAGNLISRFGYLDRNLENELKEISAIEQANLKNTIIAEIVHLPEARTGNILQRPDFRKAEIVLIARSSERSTSIKASDLFLFMSGNRLVLWSKSLNSEIIPRLTSAHNFYHGINIYRFLADLQSQDKRLDIRWDWGILSKESFLPRIRYKNIIISRASWNVTQLIKAYALQEEETVFQELKKKYNLPNHVVLVEGDNELLLDLSNNLAKKIFLEKVSKENLFLQEFLFTQFRSPIRDSEGLTYANEIIIPLHSKNEIEQAVIPPPSTDLKRIFPLGSIWVYTKIYCGQLFADALLQTSIPTIIQELKMKGVLNKWFFIRYSDPAPHIRLRVEGISRNDFAIITQTIQDKLSPMLDGNQIVTIQFDTYVREIERYTPECMVLSEELFFHDSEYVLDTLMKCPIIKERWLPAIEGVDEILKSGGFSISEKHNFCEKMKSSFALEFGANKLHDLEFNQKFRERKHLIESHLLRNQGIVQFQNRSGTIENITKVVEYSNLDGKPIAKRNALIASYIHMFINRLFPTDQRLYEFAIYHFLNNYYRMIIGKHKNQKALQAS